MQTSAYPCIYFNTIVVIPTATIHIYKLNVHANPNIRLAKKTPFRRADLFHLQTNK